jgi:hypothetical protein
MREQACCLKLLLALASAVILRSIVTILHSLKFETSFLSPPTTRTSMVDIFDPASTLDTNSLLQSQSYITTDGQSASLSRNEASIWDLTTRSSLLSNSCGFIDVGRILSDERMGLSFTTLLAFASAVVLGS